jgi:predicted RND superfamily exporter protein
VGRGDAVARYAAAVVRWPLTLLAVAGVAVAACSVGLTRLTLDSDYRAFFSDSNPELAAYEAFQDTYTHHDNLLVVLAPAGGDAFTAQTLAAVQLVTDAAWRLPHAVRVDSVTNFQHATAAGDDIVVESLLALGTSPDRSTLARIRAVALAEPELRGSLVSRAGDVTAVSVRVLLPAGDRDAVIEVAGAARALAELTEAAYPDIDVRLTGNVMLNAAFPEATLADLRTLVPAMFAAVTLLVAVLLRSLGATIVTLVTVVLAALCALGLAGWLGIVLTPPSMAAPTIVMTIAVANCVHLFSALVQRLSVGTDRRRAVADAVAFNARPITYTNLTTALGFACLNFGDAPPLRDLGNVTALGVIAAFVLSMSVVPASAALMRWGTSPKAPHGGVLLGWWADLVVRRWRSLLLGSLVVTAALAACIPRIVLNDQFVEYFDREVPFRADTDFVMERLTGIYRIHYDVRASGGSGGILEPDYLGALDAFASWLRAQPEVVHVSALSDVLRRLNRTLHGDDPAWSRLPDRAALVAQYLLLYELSVPFGLDLSDRIAVDRSGTRVSVTLVNIDNRGLRLLVERADDWLARNAPPSMRRRPVGAPVLFAEIASRNIELMLLGTGLAVVLIALALAVALRSVRAGLLSLVPNCVPAVTAFGVWALVVGEVGLALSVVTAMTLGIVVDDTVHFMSAYLSRRRTTSATPAQAVRFVFARVGPALLHTSVVLAAGFVILGMSAFQVNQALGQLTALIIVLALIADFTLLPALLLWLGDRLR